MDLTGYKSKLVVVRSTDKLSGTITDFNIDIGNNLQCDNYTDCFIKFVDCALETTATSGANGKTPQLDSKDIYFVHSNLGQSSWDSGGHSTVLGYVKQNRAGNATGTTGAGSVHQALTPGSCVVSAPIPKGIVNFSIKSGNWVTLPVTSLTSCTIILQILYKTRAKSF